MKTRIFTSREISQAGQLIARGDIVAFPTETVYGLGANAYDPEAIKKIFFAKGRPSDNPLIIHIAHKKELFELADISVDQKKIIDKLTTAFWPGPLTFILQKKKSIPLELTGGLETVAIRMPKNAIARSLIRAAGVPIAAPSANISGKPSGTCFEHVFDDFDGKIPGIIKSKSCMIGLESTVIDLTTTPPELLRPGSISAEQIRSIIPALKIYRQKKSGPAKSPGMKYKHYSPNAQVVLFELSGIQKIDDYRTKYKKLHKRIAVIRVQKDITFSKKLFKIFRECDKRHIDYILITAVSEDGIGLALMNRIRKAASVIVR